MSLRGQSAVHGSENRFESSARVNSRVTNKKGINRRILSNFGLQVLDNLLKRYNSKAESNLFKINYFCSKLDELYYRNRQTELILLLFELK